MAEADDQFWAGLLAQVSDNDTAPSVTKVTRNRYASARKRAMARGFIYRPADSLIEDASTNELIARLEHVASNGRFREIEAEAILGTATQAAPLVSEALQIYFERIAIGTLKNKSESQKKNFKQPKERAIANFIANCGDLPMDQITRDHAKAFFEWWGKRLLPDHKPKPLSADGANREIGNLRNLFREYWSFEGDDTRQNPFKGLRFKDVVYNDVAPFSNDWVREEILKPNQFDGLNREAALLVYAMIETGCRPSELANLLPNNIKLEDEIPHIQIKVRQDRKLKSKSAVRDIPLVGVSLLAFQQAPEGFPHYLDKGTLLSNALMKAFRSRELFETDDQRIYSFRHAFEKRMLEAGLDYGLRCLLMGHKNSRPSYGDGGSMVNRPGNPGGNLVGVMQR